MSDDLAPLLPRVGKGDKTALATLYRALETPLYRFIRSRLNDPHEAADLLHDVFIEVWRSADRFEGRSQVKTWVFGIAYRKVIDSFRKSGRVDLPGEVPEQIDETADAEACVLAVQEAAHVRHCMDQLGTDHRAAVALAFYEDMSYSQIAEVVDAPEGTIKTRVYHAKKLLMRCLSGLIDRGAPA